MRYPKITAKKVAVMKSLIILIPLLLTACVTTSTPVKTVDMSKLEFGKGMGFTKKNFNLEDYAWRVNKCPDYDTETQTAEERFENCMRIGGYRLVALSDKELERRSQALEQYKLNRTHGENKFFDKKNFNYEEFAKASVNCGERSRNIKTYTSSAPFGTDLAGQLVYSVIGGYNKSKQQREYAARCMFKDGYILRELPPEEIKRRTEYVKEYRKNLAD